MANIGLIDSVLSFPWKKEDFKMNDGQRLLLFFHRQLLFTFFIPIKNNTFTHTNVITGFKFWRAAFRIRKLFKMHSLVYLSLTSVYNQIIYNKYTQ